MNSSIKWLFAILALFLMIFIVIDQLVCGKWIYHDYTAGIDRRLSCFWKY
ncbi:hypothetical protein [Polynucleobacter sp. MWH-UH2A]|nr:hypothetical protein [Polynucleobacter sp. MWH-UH2A]QWD63711.1 hypothetical protein IC571_08485 [Polynucleobacter sp. MWH-UH2A]